SRGATVVAAVLQAKVHALDFGKCRTQLKGDSKA
ncbi:MAG: hypothetical protein RL748_1172, partial [Pseudomonadota bacterium]